MAISHDVLYDPDPDGQGSGGSSSDGGTDSFESAAETEERSDNADASQTPVS